MSSWHSDPRPLRLGPFLESLRERLEELSKDDLNERLLAHARTLEPAERRRFLEVFEKDSTGGEVRSDGALLDDVDDLIEDLREGSFVDGWGWDHDVYDERAWGDESWAPRMDALFERAGCSFVDGDLELAAEAYRRLLGAFELEDLEGQAFSGALPPEEMLDTDLPEAEARLARSIYETVEPSRRAGALLAEIQDASLQVDRETGLLRAMEDSREAPLPDLEAFLPEWIDALERSKQEADESRLEDDWDDDWDDDDWDPDEWDLPDSWERMRRTLLREAVTRYRGVEGLAALARRSEDSGAYLEWARLEARQGDLRGALVALGEALDGLSKSRERAEVADRLAALAAIAGQRELAVCSRTLAWRISPTVRRLRNLAQASLEDAPDPEEELTVILEAELEALGSEELRPDEACAGLVEVLAGDFASAARRLEAASTVGWSTKSHPGWWLLPVLLLAGVGIDEAPEETVLEDLWLRLDGARREDALEVLFGNEEALWIEKVVDVAPPEPPRLSELASMALRRPMLEAGERQALLGTCRRVVVERARHIVSHKFRRAYDRAAAVSVACAEAYLLTGSEDSGRRLLRQLREEFPRHSAFKRSLEEHEGWSSVLSPRKA